MTAEDDFRDACFREDIEAASALISRLDLHWRDPSSGWSLLHVAVEHGHAGLVQELVAAGIDLDMTDNAGWTPLCLAVDADIDGATQAEAPLELPMTRLLLQLGSDPHGGRGITPVEIASEYGSEEAVRLLSQSPGAA